MTEPRLVLTPAELAENGLTSQLASVKPSSIAQLRSTSSRFTRQNWLDRFGATYRPLISTENFQIGLYTHNGMFVVCFPRFLMIDFDTDNKAEAVAMLQTWCAALEKHTGTPLHFTVLETDGGIHAFLTSHPADPTSDNTVGAMLQLKSDRNYASFALFRGFCVRLNPKIYLDKPDETGRVVRTQERVANAIVARPCFDNVCTVGTGQVDPRLQNLLAFKMDMIAYLRKYTIDHFAYFENNNTVVPSEAMVQEVLRTIRRVLPQYGLVESGVYPMRGFVPLEEEEQEQDDLYVTVGGVRGVSTYAQYDQILAQPDLKACRGVSVAKLYHLRDALRRGVEKDAIVYMVKPGKHVKFFMGFDPARRMAFIVFGDLFTADWDFTPTLGPSTVERLVKQFLRNVEHMDPEARFRKTPLAFRMFSTDNGMHGFCTSHTFPHNSLDTQRLGVSMCSDPAYIAFSRLRGFSLRLTPKVTKREGGAYVLDPDPKRDQFVQRPYTPAPVIAGNGARENKGLVAVVQYVYDLQRRILALPNLYERLMVPDGADPTLLKDMRDAACELWCDLLVKAQYRQKDGVDYVEAHRAFGCTPSTCSVMRHPKYKQVNVSRRHAREVGVQPFHTVRSSNTALWSWVRQQTPSEMPKW